MRLKSVNSDRFSKFTRLEKTKMLSINIPVYNIQVTDLVWQLIKQAERISVDFEIRIYDDGSEESTKNVNRKLAEIPQVIYREIEKNLGRAAIRNKMGLETKKTYLLFIDADSKLISDDFLQKYIELAKPGVVLCGGTSYSPQMPDNEKKLRWVYGHRREAISAEKRNSKKGFIITSNNFMIDRKTFQKIHFRENIGPYGHEDTLLGFDLFAAGIVPQHIDNPIEHTGLEDSGIFLNKTKTALENLLFISEKILHETTAFQNQMPFLNRYHKITKIIPPVLLKWFFYLFGQTIAKNLTGKNPNLFLFDMYKLGYFSSLKKNKPALKN
jgi:glycosyltransferase involved in cell wall biosynthesis